MPDQTVTTRAHNRCGTMAQYKKLSGLWLSDTPRSGTATFRRGGTQSERFGTAVVAETAHKRS